MTPPSDAIDVEPNWRTGDLLDQISAGDQVQIDHDYISGPLTVVRKTTTIQGRCLVVTSAGGSTYRLRQTGQDDDLLFEKYHGGHSPEVAVFDFDAWEPHLRVKASRYYVE